MYLDIPVRLWHEIDSGSGSMRSLPGATMDLAVSTGRVWSEPGRPLHLLLVSADWCCMLSAVRRLTRRFVGRTQHMSHDKRREFITHKATSMNSAIVQHLPKTLVKKFEDLEIGELKLLKKPFLA